VASLNRIETEQQWQRVNHPGNCQTTGRSSTTRASSLRRSLLAYRLHRFGNAFRRVARCSRDASCHRSVARPRASHPGSRHFCATCACAFRDHPITGYDNIRSVIPI
jgi:hypothetical protein